MKKNNYKGKFIAIEGLNGCGKTTQAILLADFLKQRGIEVILTKEPTVDLSTGQFIRHFLEKKESISPASLQLLFAADRGQHQEKIIIPALRRGAWVMSDRCQYSSFAFGAIDLPMNWLININNRFILPDFTFLLKVDAKICIDRLKKRDKDKQLFHDEKILQKVWAKYEHLATKLTGLNIQIINGEQPIEKVFADIKMITEKFITEVK